MSDDGSGSEGEGGDFTCGNPAVVEKYKYAARFAAEALAAVVAKCAVGARVAELCELGDKTATQLAGAAFSRAKDEHDRPMERGLASPTCVNVGANVSNFSPSDDCAATIADGDVVRVDLGVQIDGFAAFSGTTVVVGTPSTADPTGVARVHAALEAAHVAQDAAIRTMRPGATNQDVTAVVARVCAAYGVEACEGVLSHRIERWDAALPDSIILKRVPTLEPPHQVQDVTFEAGQVWTLDIALSTGSGRLRPSADRPLVWRRVPDARVALRMAAARDVMTFVGKKAHSFPFATRTVEDGLAVAAAGDKPGAAAAAAPTPAERARLQAAASLGLRECAKNGLIVPHPTVTARPADTVVRLVCTVLIRPTQIEPLAVVASASRPPAGTVAATADAELAAALGRGLSLGGAKKKKRAKKPKAPKAEGAAAAAKPEDAPK